MAENIKDQYRSMLRDDPKINLMFEFKDLHTLIRESRAMVVTGLLGVGVGLLTDLFIRRQINRNAIKTKTSLLFVETIIAGLGASIVVEGIHGEVLARQALEVLKEESSRRVSK